MRRLAPALLACGAIAAAVAAPASAQIPTLAGTTSISGSAGWTLVQLDQPVSVVFSPERNVDVSFDDGGAIRAAALRSVEADADGEHDYLIFKRVGAGWSAAGGPVLDPGVYRLHLVSDTADGSATLRFDDLPGALSLTPTTARPVKRVEGTVRPSALAPATILESASIDLDAIGVATFHLRWQTGEAPTRTQRCFYFGAEPAHAYEPTCPGGHDGNPPDVVPAPAGQVDAPGTTISEEVNFTTTAPIFFGYGMNFTSPLAPSVSETVYSYTFADASSAPAAAPSGERFTVTDIGPARVVRGERSTAIVRTEP